MPLLSLRFESTKSIYSSILIHFEQLKYSKKFLKQKLAPDHCKRFILDTNVTREELAECPEFTKDSNNLKQELSTFRNWTNKLDRLMFSFTTEHRGIVFRQHAIHHLISVSVTDKQNCCMDSSSAADRVIRFWISTSPKELVISTNCKILYIYLQKFKARYKPQWCLSICHHGVVYSELYSSVNCHLISSLIVLISPSTT